MTAGHAASLHAHAHGSLGSYLAGFGLSVLLTAIPFALVMTGALDSKEATGIAIAAFAATQIVVHMVYFLHMNTRSEGGWTMMALIFTLILVVIALAGSMWVMYHLNANMMPDQDMGQMPASGAEQMPAAGAGHASGAGPRQMPAGAMEQMPAGGSGQMP